MLSREEYHSGVKEAWCPGCGNFGILNAEKRALVELQLAPEKILIVSGIGQAGKFPHYLRCNFFNGLHGRALPVALAAKLANPELTVIVHNGDGDCYGEGGNHFIHTIRRNPDITCIVHNNKVYGLTKGQASPTSDKGFKTKVQPYGVIHEPLNPLALAISLDCSFVARGYVGDLQFLAELIKAGIQHKGFALIDILQPCPTFNRVNTFRWYEERVYHLEEDREFDPKNQLKAFHKALEWGERIPLGVFYLHPKPTMEEQIPALAAGPLYRQKIQPSKVLDIMEELSALS
ncbi:MAG: 2-oxoacid:ferredoxin oxidoreductase subunit beta [bacterium]|nr:2-oxoacid:ferredoxin oxidoreductase subunit beta [bacterium]